MAGFMDQYMPADRKDSKRHQWNQELEQSSESVINLYLAENCHWVSISLREVGAHAWSLWIWVVAANMTARCRQGPHHVYNF